MTRSQHARAKQLAAQGIVQQGPPPKAPGETITWHRNPCRQLTMHFRSKVRTSEPMCPMTSFPQARRRRGQRRRRRRPPRHHQLQRAAGRKQVRRLHHRRPCKKPRARLRGKTKKVNPCIASIVSSRTQPPVCALSIESACTLDCPLLTIHFLGAPHDPTHEFAQHHAVSGKADAATVEVKDKSSSQSSSSALSGTTSQQGAPSGDAAGRDGSDAADSGKQGSGQAGGDVPASGTPDQAPAATSPPGGTPPSPPVPKQPPPGALFGRVLDAQGKYTMKAIPFA